MTLRRLDTRLGPHDVHVDRRADGTLLVRSPHPLLAYPRTVTDRLDEWARRAPARVFLADRARETDGWRTIRYDETRQRVRRLAGALLDLGATGERGLAILSGNGIEHALLALAAQYVGIPYAPISPHYALRSADFMHLRRCLALFDPAVAFVADADAFAPALASGTLDPAVPVIVAAGALPHRATLRFDELLARAPSADVDEANGSVTPETVAKILFTSGSTGTPKGVITTQRMLCSNQQMCLQAFPFWADGMTLVDWAPWSHTAGSSQTFNMVLFNGGTMYVDDGAPTRDAMSRTIRNLREISPTIAFNVPRGFELLADAMTDDTSLRRSFFARLEMMWFGGATLAQSVFERLRAMARAETGARVLLTNAFGATETAPSIFFANFAADASANVGVPLPGVEAKLVPCGDAYEVRVRGDCVTPGYRTPSGPTRAGFDDDGFFGLGDRLVPVDDTDLMRGFLFCGRIDDDFKLTTGTWVRTTMLRDAVLAELRPLVDDVVVCGADRNEVSVLLVGHAATACAWSGEQTPAAAYRHPRVRAYVAARLRAFAAAHPGTSRHPVRASFIPIDPSIYDSLMTNKGTLRTDVARTYCNDAIRNTNPREWITFDDDPHARA